MRQGLRAGPTPAISSLEVNKSFILGDAVAGAQQAAVLGRDRIALGALGGAERLLVENRHLATPRGIVLAVVGMVEEETLRALAPNAEELWVRVVERGEGVVSVELAEVLIEVERVNFSQLVSQLDALVRRDPQLNRAVIAP